MSGTFLTELTGVSTIVGMILIAIITVILVKYRDKLIRYANSIMTIVLLVGFVVISLLVVYLFGPQVKALLSSWYVPEACRSGAACGAAASMRLLPALSH